MLSVRSLKPICAVWSEIQPSFCFGWSQPCFQQLFVITNHSQPPSARVLITFSSSFTSHNSSSLPGKRYFIMLTLASSLADDLLNVIDQAIDNEEIEDTIQEIQQFTAFYNSEKTRILRNFNDIYARAEEIEQQIKMVQADGVDNSQLESLLNELKEEQEKEKAYSNELSGIESEMNKLELEAADIKRHKKELNGVKEDEERTKCIISLYASVTKAIPSMKKMEKQKCFFLEKKKRNAELFELDELASESEFDRCNKLWDIGDTI